MAKPPRILVVTARYYADIVTALEQGAFAALEEAGAVYDWVEAPGAFEIPTLIAHGARQGMFGQRYQGFVALGCVIRGETSHYDYVCGESARALMELSVNFASDPSEAPTGLAIGYGILTVENQEQAWARAKPASEGGKNKGAEAARACLAVIQARAYLDTEMVLRGG